MTIQILKDDILKETEGYIVHGCNIKTMGSGIAGQIRKKYPQVYEAFLNHKKTVESLGDIQLVEIDEHLTIINAFTQLNYGYDGQKYANASAIKQCLDRVFQLAELYNKEIKMVKIGCGLGGLSWDNDVHPIILELNKKYDNNVNVKIFEYE